MIHYFRNLLNYLIELTSLMMTTSLFSFLIKLCLKLYSIILKITGWSYVRLMKIQMPALGTLSIFFQNLHCYFKGFYFKKKSLFSDFMFSSIKHTAHLKYLQFLHFTWLKIKLLLWWCLLHYEQMKGFFTITVSCYLFYFTHGDYWNTF